jgi:hypothetical protein
MLDSPTCKRGCWKVDECKSWADKALALASYARQAGDEGLYKVAMRIQGRATRRFGELLREMKADSKANLKQNRGKGYHTSVMIKKAAADAGLSKHQVTNSSCLAYALDVLCSYICLQCFLGS